MDRSVAIGGEAGHGRGARHEAGRRRAWSPLILGLALTLAPAQRADVILDLGGRSVGSSLQLVSTEFPLGDVDILRGRPGTAMPPWHGFVSEPEARWIVEQLRKGLPQ